MISRRLGGPWLPWAALNVLGVILVALPDPDRRIVSFSRTHGPGPADLAGSILLLTGWMILDLYTWRHRRALTGRAMRRVMLLFAVAAILGAVLLAWSISQDAGMWWLLGAALIGAVQLAAGWLAGRRAEPVP